MNGRMPGRRTALEEVEQVDRLRHRVRTALEHARRGLDPADGRLLQRRVLGLRAEVAAAGYPPVERRRLLASCDEALAEARWASWRSSVPPHWQTAS